MSWKASAWAKEQRLGSPAAKSILMCLADSADAHSGECWPSQARLAEDAEVSERTAREWLQRLEDWGLITRRRRNRASGARNSDLIVLNLDCRIMDGADRCREIKGQECGDGENLPAISAGRSYRQPSPDQPAAGAEPTGNQFRAYKEEPPIEPPSEPIERERSRDEAEEAGDPKRIEARGWALLKDWPGFAGMPKEPAMKDWRAMSAVDRDKAERRFPGWLALLKAQRKSHIPAPSSYFGQKLFDEVPEPADPAATPKRAAPFGKLWGVVRMARLLDGPGPMPAPSRFIQHRIDAGGAEGECERLAHQARHGFPAVNLMHDWAANGAGITVPGDEGSLDRLAALMEPVRVGSGLWTEWEVDHGQRGWPWLPDPGRQEWVYFPAGGPGAMGDFERAVRGARDDGGGREAAE